MKPMLGAVLLPFLIGGCAGPTQDVKGGYCAINEPRWPAASRDFDRATTIETIAALDAAARGDREKLKQGARGDVGANIDMLYQHDQRSSAFISNGVAELANRLRQLDCAVRANRVDSARAEQSYEQILAELAAERATLDPSAKLSSQK